MPTRGWQCPLTSTPTPFLGLSESSLQFSFKQNLLAFGLFLQNILVRVTAINLLTKMKRCYRIPQPWYHLHVRCFFVCLFSFSLSFLQCRSLVIFTLGGGGGNGHLLFLSKAMDIQQKNNHINIIIWTNYITYYFRFRNPCLEHPRLFFFKSCNSKNWQKPWEFVEQHDGEQRSLSELFKFFLRKAGSSWFLAAQTTVRLVSPSQVGRRCSAFVPRPPPSALGLGFPSHCPASPLLLWPL